MALVIMDLRWDTSVEAVEFPIRRLSMLKLTSRIIDIPTIVILLLIDDYLA